MPTDPAKSCETLVEKIETGEREITDDRDRKLLLDLNDRLELLREEYSDYRRLKILRHATRMAEHAGCLTDALDDLRE